MTPDRPSRRGRLTDKSSSSRTSLGRSWDRVASRSETARPASTNPSIKLKLGLYGHGTTRATLRRMEEQCIFCRIIGGEEMVSVVYEDDRAIAFLDIQPVSAGHTLVVSKEHYETVFDLPDELL